jgi:predicted acetyltransferase
VKSPDVNTELRALTPDDAYPNRLLMNHAFGRGAVVPPPNPDDPPREMNNTWGVFENGTLQASLAIVPFLVHWGPSLVLPMGGIAGVATFAEARGRGYVDQLLRHSLETMRTAGQVISALYPFSWGFYRRYGWDWVGEKRNIRLPLAQVRSAPEGREVRNITGDGAREKTEAYCTRFARKYRGIFTTETRRWGRALSHDEGRTTYVYAHEPSESYLLWRYEAKQEEGTAREFVANAPEGDRALLSLLHYFGTQCETASLTVPADSPLWSHVMHWDLETKIEPVFSGRVVDFGPAMMRLEPSPETPNGSVTLALTDEHAPWNAGIWRITVEDGKIHAATVVGGADDADVTADIQALSQAYWGMPDLHSLRRAGRVTVTNEPGFDLLSRLLPPTPIFTMDHF